MLLLGVGMGLAFVPLTMTSLAGVAPEDSGAAASMVNVMQQVGGALGLAILVSVFGAGSRSAARHPLAHGGAIAQAHHVLIGGMSAAFTVAALFDLVALLVVITLIRMRSKATAPEAEPEPAPAVLAAAEMAE
jgi:MFS family permease